MNIEKLKENNITKKISKLNAYQLKKLNRLKESDKYLNKLHLSAYSGHLNDPNGLVKYNNKYHIFYQWSPFNQFHALKHWGHFATKDFISFQHTGCAIIPDTNYDKDGAFSGSGYVYNKNIYIFYTGNIKELGSSDDKRSSWTIRAELNKKNNKIINKEPLFEVDKNIYTGHFRDPRIVFKNNKFYMLNGTQTINKKGAISVHESTSIIGNFIYKGTLKLEGQKLSKGKIFECPDFFEIKDKHYLILSVVKAKKINDNQNRDLTYILEGKISFKNMVFKIKKESLLDEGFDFYAPQLFQNTKRKILLGWAGAIGSESYATFDKGWAHDLTLPRELTLNTNGNICQNPIKEFNTLRKKQIIIKDKLLRERQVDFNSEIIDGSKIQVLGNNGHINIKVQDNKIIIDRSSMDVPQGTKYGFQREIQLKSKPKNLRMIIDSSIIEVYINNGENVATFKFWLEGNLKINTKNVEKIKSYKLNCLNIKWSI